MKAPLAAPKLARLLFLGCLSAAAQSPQTSSSLAVSGYTGQTPTVQLNGKTYVDVEALARLTHGSISFQGSQLVLSLSPAPAAPAAARPQKGFSQNFLRAGIEQMTVIREWRIAIVSAVQNNSAVTENWVGNFRRDAESRLNLAGAAATTDADRSGFQLLSNEFRNMQQLSDQFLALNASRTFTPTTAFDNNPLDVKVLGCARAMAAMAANNQFQDEPSCH